MIVWVKMVANQTPLGYAVFMGLKGWWGWWYSHS